MGLGDFVILPVLALAATVYPFSVIPGGLPPDHTLAKKGCYYVGFRFAGQLMWTDYCVTLKKGEPMAGTRRARCGNPVARALPPGAHTLPSGLRFVVPLMDRPLPALDEPPRAGIEPSWPPLLEPPALILGHPGTFGGIGIWVPADGGPPPCRKHKPCRVEGQPTPEPSTWLMIAAGIILILMWLKLQRRIHQ